MTLEFKRLTEIGLSDIVSLNNNPSVLRQMPLGGAHFDDVTARTWVNQKDAQWEQHGYGPWAFLIDQQFAGWGGLQHENGDADLALVLHPTFWGRGRAIYQAIVERAFTEMGLSSITILLPPTRTRIKAIFRLGFQADGEVDIDGVRFLRFRLYGPSNQADSDD
ncbi:hypothetical protein D3C77_233540 [compost metagenome]|uniref:GNAT family N-acetyltransferase n=1 Tax=Pseudomonas TaxID=286 RepID=UPI000419C3A6|nr:MULTISPECIES: GNAT family N-acetyltransferase [Pseudomonas]MCW2271956.1 RimJ/RimL family protein N-acetyltransferase [Pseudomonas sp. JUb96]